MSVRTPDYDDVIYASANLPGPIFSACGWSKFRTLNAGTTRFLFTLFGNSYAKYASLAWESDNVFRVLTDAGSTAFSGNPSTSGWYWWGITQAGTGGTDLKAYWRNEADVALTTVSMTGVTFTSNELQVGIRYFGTNDAEIRYSRIWDNRVLTAGEMLAESLSPTVVSATSLNRDMRLASAATALTDSANGYTMLTTGSGFLDGASEPSLATAKSASDTASLSATEDPTNLVTIASLDTATLSVSESVVVSSSSTRLDTASLSVADASSLSVSNSGVIAGTDAAASLAVTESSSVAVSLARTDTTSLSVTDASAIVVTSLGKAVTDTASLAAADFAAVFVVGVTIKEVADLAAIYIEDASLMSLVNPPRSRNGGRIFIGRENRTLNG